MIESISMDTSNTKSCSRVCHCHRELICDQLYIIPSSSRGSSSSNRVFHSPLTQSRTPNLLGNDDDVAAAAAVAAAATTATPSCTGYRRAEEHARINIPPKLFPVGAKGVSVC